MNARMETKLLHYGVHPAVIASHVAYVTQGAAPSRITPSRRVNKALRRVWVVMGILAVVVGARVL